MGRRLMLLQSAKRTRNRSTAAVALSAKRTSTLPLSISSSLAHRSRNGFANHIRSPFEGIVLDVGVSVGCCGLLMPQKLADDRQAEPTSGTDRGEGVPKIMQTNTFEPRVLSDLTPGPMQVSPRCIRRVSSDHVLAKSHKT